MSLSWGASSFHIYRAGQQASERARERARFEEQGQGKSHSRHLNSRAHPPPLAPTCCRHPAQKTEIKKRENVQRQGGKADGCSFPPPPTPNIQPSAKARRAAAAEERAQGRQAVPQPRALRQAGRQAGRQRGASGNGAAAPLLPPPAADPAGHEAPPADKAAKAPFLRRGLQEHGALRLIAGPQALLQEGEPPLALDGEVAVLRVHLDLAREERLRLLSGSFVGWLVGACVREESINDKRRGRAGSSSTRRLYISSTRDPDYTP